MNKNISDHNAVIIRKGTKSDLTEMRLLFEDTITSVCKKDYSEIQLEAWRSGAENKERWLTVIENQFVLVAVSRHKIVGFCTLDKGNHVDLLFVDKTYQRQGIAYRLYTLIEKGAIKLNKERFTADVSKTAKPFFEKIGFKILKEQTVTVKGINLINYKMEKKLR